MLRVVWRPVCLAGVLAWSLAACLFPVPAAKAADLGDCCADLEARVAVLEAAAVRRAGRVSVTLSGYVTKQVMSWDDGVEKNTYVADIGPTQATNFRINGQATIVPGWTAGYMIRVQDLSDNTIRLNQFLDNDNQGLNVQMSNWYLASTDYGKLTVGKQAMASKSVAMYTDLSGTQLIANYVLFDGGGFFLRQDEELLRLRWGDIGYCYAQARPWGGDCDGIVIEGLRYDSPTWAGFSWSGSYGEDDDWEVAGRYAGEMGGFKVALGVGYSVNTDENTQLPRVSLNKNSGFFQVGGYVEHLATGLFLHADYGNESNHGSLILSGIPEPNGHQWYVKGGMRRTWTGLGATILYGEYMDYIDEIGPAALNAGVTSSEFTRWGFGIAQEIDKAAMTLWLKYRQHDGELAGGPFAGGLDEFRYISAGGLIYF